MARKLETVSIRPLEGGFVVMAEFRDRDMNDHRAYETDEYIVPTYAKMMKCIKEELADFKPVRKQHKAKEIA